MSSCVFPAARLKRRQRTLRIRKCRNKLGAGFHAGISCWDFPRWLNPRLFIHDYLALTRKVSQTIVISHPKTGEPIEVTVVEIQGEHIRLGINAPRSVSVDRTEIAASKAAERSLA